MSLSSHTRWLDVDDPSTWPAALFARAQELAADLRNTTEYQGDLGVPLAAEDDFRALPSGCLVRAYHATQLLDHEVQMIRTQGLRPLSAESVKDRIDAAYEHSCISAAEKEMLHHSHVFETGEAEYRAGQCCFFLPETMLLNRPRDVNPLLSTWGGEAIKKSSRAAALPARLSQLGRPAVVIAHLDLSPGHTIHWVFPDIQKVFTARILNLEDMGADVFHRGPVPPQHITAIWQPGDAEYDKFEDLPSC